MFIPFKAYPGIIVKSFTIIMPARSTRRSAALVESSNTLNKKKLNEISKDNPSAAKGNVESAQTATNIGKKRKRNELAEPKTEEQTSNIGKLSHGQLGGVDVKSEPVESQEEKKTKKHAKKKNPAVKKEEDNESPPTNLSQPTSPFPNYPRPTPEECHTVFRLLKTAHPTIGRSRPPAPSQTTAGCGDVPSILDALIRTLLSANTNGRNSSTAYRGMIARYGLLGTGIGKGSVDYHAVHLAPQSDLEQAIARGGLAKVKSKNIKAILDRVYAENQQRAREKKTGPSPPATQDDDADPDLLSLTHLTPLPTPALLTHLTSYPGIGPKTAACVALFCMGRACFPVDTHVFRICKWLGWVPDQAAPGYVRAKGEPRVGREEAQRHLDFRVPEELKGGLHEGLVVHGKRCGKCAARESERGERCVLEGLVDRGRGDGGGKGRKAEKAGKTAAAKGTKKRRRADSEDEDEDEEEIEMSDLVEDEDDEGIEGAVLD